MPTDQPKPTIKPAVTIKSTADDITKPMAPKEPGRRDLACAQLGRHRPNCECTGDMRAPIA
jgi:hypothetical protein